MNQSEVASGAEIQSLAKGLAVIRTFGPDRSRLTLTEVANLNGLSRAGARRVLHTLRSLGYVSSDGRYFRLEPSILELGYSYLASLPWWQTAQSTIETLADRSGLPVAAGVMDGQFVTYVAHARPRRFENFPRSIGTRIPIATSAIGRVLLAALPDDELTAKLSCVQIEKLTPTTLSDADELRTAIRRAHDLDYALADQELEIGLTTLAVPIRNRRGQTVAAVGIGSFDRDIGIDIMVERNLPPLRKAAERISAAIPD